VSIGSLFEQKSRADLAKSPNAQTSKATKVSHISSHSSPGQQTDNQQGDCDTSKFNIRDVYLSNFTGTVRGGIVSTMQCSAAAPCRNIHMSNIVLENSSNHTTPRQYQCDSVKETVGFLCTGPPDGEDNAF
jgi:hypothetical protein